eukprot:3254457-Pyramimonas_sp.AAC.1
MFGHCDVQGHSKEIGHKMGEGIFLQVARGYSPTLHTHSRVGAGPLGSYCIFYLVLQPRRQELCEIFMGS